ncbi:MAG: hypothetical protein VB962_01485 [Pseudohongiellaceae bacterium]
MGFRVQNLKRVAVIMLSVSVLFSSFSRAQERSQYQHWLELSAADQNFADRSDEIGRTRAFLEFLGEDSVVFRGSRNSVDARTEYSNPEFQRGANEIAWEAHYIDVSRDGDLGLSAGPLTVIGGGGDPDLDSFGHLVSIWKKNAGRWVLMADIVVGIPGFLSLGVEPNFDDTRPVLEETAHPVMVMTEDNTLQSLIESDNRFGRSINIRGGQRALLRWGLTNTRVYLPDMGPAVGREAASSVYGAFLDNQLSTTNPVSLTHVGGYLSTSKEVGYTYGTMETNVDTEIENNESENDRFQANYLRLWRFSESNEWKIAVEVLSPYSN